MQCLNCFTDMEVFGKILGEGDTVLRTIYLCPHCNRRVEYSAYYEINGRPHTADVVERADGYEIEAFRFVDQFEGWLPDGGSSDVYATVDEAIRALNQGVYNQKLLNGSL